MNYLDAVATQIEAELHPSLRPDEQATELYRLYALLALTRGNETSLQNVHDAWSVWMASRQPDHAALVPFSELRVDQQEQDRPYADAILRVVRSAFSRLG
jgi:hypothetical protein